MITVEFIYRNNPAFGTKATFATVREAAAWARVAHGREHRPGTRYSIVVTR